MAKSYRVGFAPGSWFMLALATILAIGLITRDSAVMVQSLSEKITGSREFTAIASRIT